MMFLVVKRILSSCLVVISAFLLAGQTRPAFPIDAREIPVRSPAIVIGFVGGFVRRDNAVHSVIQVAARLRREYAAGVAVEAFENHKGDNAHRKILNLLDSNHNGSLSVEEKRNSRIIIYGHSWGGSEAIALARRLEQDGIPVLLTIQVDSVPKIGEASEVIPANVVQAANFYQTDGLLRGEPKIRAEDATRTRILGNFRFSYAESPYNCVDYPWYNRVFMKAHTQIECDPKVWNQVESLIRSNLPPQ